MINLNLRGVIFTPSSNVLVTFCEAKNNLYGNVVQSCIANLDWIFCPLVMFPVYIDMLVEKKLCLEDPLFPSLTTQGKIKKGSCLTDDNA